MTVAAVEIAIVPVVLLDNLGEIFNQLVELLCVAALHEVLIAHFNVSLVSA